MYDAGKILTGLAVFLALITAPVWYNLAAGQARQAPKLELPAEAKTCVESKAFMVANHMDLLNTWRDGMVREGLTDYTAQDGRHYRKSLTSTCLDCHKSKARFCDRCHAYTAVAPFCFDCHLSREEK